MALLLRLFQSGLGVGSAVGKFLSTTPECPSCKVYKEWLAEEIAKRDYYESLLMERLTIGLKDEVAEPPLRTDDFTSINRITTLSAIRREARELRAQQFRTQSNAAEIANPAGLTEAEKLFEESLNGKESDEVREQA